MRFAMIDIFLQSYDAAVRQGDSGQDPAPAWRTFVSYRNATGSPTAIRPPSVTAQSSTIRLRFRLVPAWYVWNSDAQAQDSIDASAANDAVSIDGDARLALGSLGKLLVQGGGWGAFSL